MIDFDSLGFDNMDNSDLDNSDIGTESTFGATSTNELASGHFTDSFGSEFGFSGGESSFGASSTNVNSTHESLWHGSTPQNTMSWEHVSSDFPWDHGAVSVHSHNPSDNVDLSQMDDQIAFKSSGYSQSEINSHIAEAKHEIADAESDIRHNTNIANSKARMGEPHSFEDSQIHSAQSRLNEAKSDLNKWQHMKPSK